MEAISGKTPMVKYWMHGGFLTVDGQKMCKSLNNFIYHSGSFEKMSGKLFKIFCC